MSPSKCVTHLLAVSLVILAASSVQAAPIEPNIVSVDLSFGFSGVSYDAGSGQFTGTADYAVIAFEPVIGGATYPVLNLDGNPGAAISLSALFDGLGTEFDVDAYFATLGDETADLVVTGKIPGLGIEPGAVYNGTLLEADVMLMQMYGDEGTGAFAFNGYFSVIGGDLVQAGYLSPGDTVAIVGWLSSVSPSLPQGFDFASDFTATTHSGQIGAIPEPASMTLLALAGVASVLTGRRLRRRG